MPPKTGVLIFFDEIQRGQLIRDSISRGDETFSDAISVPDFELRLASPALLSFTDSSIDFFSLMKRGKSVATAKSRVEFSDLVPLNAVSLQQLESRLGATLKQHFIRSSRGIGGMIPEQTWARTIGLIKELRPNAAAEIDRLLALSSYAGYRIEGKTSEILLQEREALGAALDIFSGNNQLREKVLGGWAPPSDALREVSHEDKRATLVLSDESKTSFSSRLPETYMLQEESALQHDLFNWEHISPMHVAGRSIFTQGKRTLEILYANRNQLEKTLGVDLIYYNEIYELFALVQYKLMREEAGRMVYRPDWQLYQELKRMDEFVLKYELTHDLVSDEEYRLNQDGFFVKLVPNYGLKPASGELIKGMYLTREYVRYLLGRYGPTGERGGRIIHFDNASRYLTNTEFTQAVNRGWVGLRRLHTKALKDLIRQYYETGRAILLAYERPTGQQPQHGFAFATPGHSHNWQMQLFQDCSEAQG